MAFFILTKGNLSAIEFDYLNHDSGSRLDPTLSPSRQQPVVIKREEAKGTFAIEVMSSPVLTVDHEALAVEAINIFKTKNIHHLVLTDGDQVKGLISDRDVSWLKKMDLGEHAMAGQFMTSMVLVCHEETPIDHLARVMVRENISAIPVVDSFKQLTGIVTHHDLLGWIFK
ncbi:MAG: CBS domain-containing protein [Bacteriovoracaceae bacterium]|nr:CBS domain-containing protein [Bacteriovoracaceae bacterium]